ncbi:single-stranded-DNA-specific exonuclease RecJ [Candidatus Nesciobacter abundans]|uniref:Single-stranded-DNA-specific exonuclease RecJ n=1 Tax=Candidatus Nesciobacter abundans TaxID=2601668 RepID=A0A5C0UHR8_9PROT|nr:DHH family phosphoesterase [Candidatus Nesciobacter abundans]QEK39260.1 hypothetical protein FZC36_02400 [Candidatus Nesciobacter abundans]
MNIFYLGKKTLRGNYLSFNDSNNEEIKKVQDSFDLNRLEAILALSRVEGIDKLGNIHKFLNDRISAYMQNVTLIDFEKALERIYIALEKKEKICILGDYDVDGITSTVMWMDFFRAYGIEVEYRIPNRSDGYGHDPDVLKSIDCSLFLILDCGSSQDFYGIQKNTANNSKKDICIIDHHQTANDPNVYAFVNPNRADSDIRTQEEYKNLCTAGLCFIFIYKISEMIEERKKVRQNISPKVFMDLVALGTIGDCMKLSGLNRAYVRYGLQIVSLTKRIGLRSLIDNLGLGNIAAGDVAFYICPCINAAGRIHSSGLAVDLLFTKDSVEAERLSKSLISLNTKRKEMEKKALDEALVKVYKEIHKEIKFMDINNNLEPDKQRDSEEEKIPERDDANNEPNVDSKQKSDNESQSVVIVRDKDWHPGLVGIIAGRIKEKENVPVFVFYKIGNEWKGSARSVKGCNIGAVIHESVLNGLATSGGGHDMAGGVAVNDEKFSEWKNWINQKIHKMNLVPEKIINIDAFLNLNGLNMTNVSKITPFGMGNPYPKIILSNVLMLSVMERGNHIMISVKDEKYKRTFWMFNSKEIAKDILENRYYDLILSLSEKKNHNVIDILKR